MTEILFGTPNSKFLKISTENPALGRILIFIPLFPLLMALFNVSCYSNYKNRTLMITKTETLTDTAPGSQ